jgi:hypothetical protein
VTAPDVVIRPVTPEDDFDAQVDLGQRAFGIYSPAQKASWLYAARLRALWSVIASHSSTASALSLYTAPNDPFWWLTKERDATIAKRSMWMLRVVDAPGAIAPWQTGSCAPTSWPTTRHPRRSARRSRTSPASTTTGWPHASSADRDLDAQPVP